MKISHKKYLSLWIVLVAGTLLTCAFVVRVYHLQSEKWKDIFNLEVKEQVNILRETIRESFNVIDAIASFNYSSSHVDREEFRRFTANFFEKYPYIQALEWIPFVPAAQRAAFEEQARQDGFTEFEFKQIGADGKMIRADEREEYYPVFYLEPYKGNQQVMGYDLASDATRYRAINESILTGSISMISHIKLVQDVQQIGTMAFRPIYQAASAYPSKENLTGLVLAVFKTGSLIKKAFENEQMHQVELAVFDVSDPQHEEFLFSNGPLNGKEAVLASRYYVKEQVEIGGIVWDVYSRPKSEYVYAQLGEPGMVLLGGLMLTLLVASSVLGRIKREEKIEEEVYSRTEELFEVNQKLKDEMMFRARTEELVKRKAMESHLIYQVTSMAVQAENVQSTLQNCVKMICDVMSWPVGHAYLVSSNKKEICPVDSGYCQDSVQYRAFMDAITKNTFRPGEGLPGRISQSGQPLCVENIQVDINPSLAQLGREMNIKGAVGFPMMIFGEVVAVLEFFSRDEIKSDEELLLVLKNLGEQVGRVLERKETERKLREEKKRLLTFQSVTLNREMEMIELKKENNELYRQLGKIPPYDLSFLSEKLFSKTLEMKDKGI